MQNNKWARLLAYVTGLVNQQLLLQNEYLAAENWILRSHLPARLRLSDPERSTLAEMGKRLGDGCSSIDALPPPLALRQWNRCHGQTELCTNPHGYRPINAASAWLCAPKNSRY
jgi:hypothetical protein